MGGMLVPMIALLLRFTLLLLVLTAYTEAVDGSLPSWHPRRFSRDKDAHAPAGDEGYADSHQADIGVQAEDSGEDTAGEKPAWGIGLDPRCGAQPHLDYDGPAVSWGLSFKLPSAAECCEACMEHKKKPGQTGDCNSWVWCPEPVCWSPDIWNHTFGECWLKVQDPNNPKINHQGEYSAEYRSHHKTAPLMVPWTAGLIDRSGR